MSWMEVNKVEQRKRFILRYVNGERMSDLCREYEISRKTGYKFLQRFKECGFGGLNDRSRRPHNIAQKTDQYLEELIIQIKSKYPTWGPKKLKIKLHEAYPGIAIPSASTIGAVLSRNGLVNKRSRRIRRSYMPSHLGDSNEANDIWCIDYKGQFRTRNRKYCYPLTVSDHKTRYLLACDAMEKISQDETFNSMRVCFKEYGLPKVIRSDNGIPFASSNSIYGLTKLSVWFLKLGIKLERIEPGHPEQNGRHERMHRTLKQDSLRIIAKNVMHQQEEFDKYKIIFNKERPHEALGQQTPHSIYKSSIHKYSAEMEKELDYPEHDFVRLVSNTGAIKISNKEVFIANTFARESVGLREFEDNWLVSFSNYDIGIIDKTSMKFESMEVLD
jgi:transposase InsO family protein